MVELESMAVEMPEVKGHPNRVEFRGVLAVVDVPSQRAPSGSRGRRVLLTKAAAERALPSLLGMALDYAPSLDRHDVQRKVGVITRAEIVGRNLEVSGYLFAKDFPEIVDEIAKGGRNAGVRAQVVRPREFSLAGVGSRLFGAAGYSFPRRWPRTSIMAASTGKLGMSYEVTSVEIADREARVWTLNRVTFTGAAVLRKDKAAYSETWIELG